MDLSKDFDSLNHNLLLTKLKVYGLDSDSVELFRSFTYNRYQRCTINNSFNKWEKVLAGTPQDSILGPLFFINDLFVFLQRRDELANYNVSTLILT